MELSCALGSVQSAILLAVRSGPPGYLSLHLTLTANLEGPDQADPPSQRQSWKCSRSFCRGYAQRGTQLLQTSDYMLGLYRGTRRCLDVRLGVVTEEQTYYRDFLAGQFGRHDLASGENRARV